MVVIHIIITFSYRLTMFITRRIYMDLQHLEYFITVVKTKNFTTASNILLVT